MAYPRVALLRVVATLIFVFPSPQAETANLADYVLTEIVERTDDEFLAFNFYDLNNQGTVAFAAQRLVGPENLLGIFTGSGGPISTIATSPSFALSYRPSINDNGTVAFTDFEAGVIFTAASDGTGVAPLITTGGPFSRFGNVDINSAGLVAFTADPAFGTITPLFGGDEGLFTTDGSSVATVVDFFGNPFRFFGTPAFSDGGAIAFYGEQDLNTGIYRVDEGGVTTIGDTVGQFAFLFPPPFFSAPPSINGQGTVAFLGRLDSGVTGIFTSGGGPPTTVVDDQGLHQFLGFPSINDDGNIMYVSHLDQQFGGVGIFSGPDPFNDRIIGFGDSLFGSTVVSVGDPVLNDVGQFVFSADLDDGRSFLVRGDPLPSGVIPEPSSFLLLGSGLLGLAGWRRRFRNKI